MKRERLIAQCFENMGEIGRLMHKFSGSEQVPKGLPTRSQTAILMTLMHMGPQGIKQLADYFGMSSSAITQLVDPLVRDRLVERHEDNNDRRKISVSVTEKGKRIMIRVKKERLAAMKSLLDPLSENELVAVQSIQEKIMEHLK